MAWGPSSSEPPRRNRISLWAGKAAIAVGFAGCVLVPTMAKSPAYGSRGATMGAGREAVYSGTLLLLAGIPVFVWLRRR